MASLTGQSIKDTYQSLLKTDDNGLITTAFKGITDGSGSTSGLYLKNNGVLLSGSITISGSLLYSGSIINATVTSASYALTASYALNGESTNTGSFLTTASVASNTITFTKGDGSTFPISVDTGSAITTPTASLLVTASVSNNTITFTKGDGSTFPITVDTGSGGGGSGTPSPSDTFIQYNSGSTFGADSSFRFIYTSQSLQQGFAVTASGIYSHAEGAYTVASGSYSHAEGSTAQAIGEYSHAEGSQTKTGTQNAYYAESVVNGILTLSGSYSDIASSFGVDDRLFLFDPVGIAKFNYVISQSYFDSTNTIVELYDTGVNIANYAYVGNLNYGEGVNEWAGDQTIPGDYSHTEGELSQAIGNSSHAEGYEAQAIGYSSHAEGNNSKSIGLYSHAEGEGAQSIGIGSHAEGAETQAIGDRSHAEGAETQAKGEYAHAEGYQTIASGLYSHAEGFNTIASGSYQHVSGQYNEHNNTSSLFVVGIGRGDAERKDGFTVDVDANGSGSVMIPNNIDLPSNPKTGSMYFDTAINYLCIYNGTEWRYISTAAVPA